MKNLFFAISVVVFTFPVSFAQEVEEGKGVDANNLENLVVIEEYQSIPERVVGDDSEKVYLEILEKTNQQLSLWFNPYGIMVGILTAFLTILAIVTAFVLYRQGSGYKQKLEDDRNAYTDKINKFIDVYKKSFDDQIKESEKRTKEIEEKSKKIIGKYEEMIKKYEEKLDGASEKQKENFEKIIADLEKQKISLQSSVEPVSGTIFPVVPEVGVSSIHRCSRCGFGFSVDTSRAVYFGGASVFTGQNQDTVTCPKCGNKDHI